MANATPQLPLDADGACMLCKVKPTEEATLTCAMCATPWHVDCLSVLPETMSSAISFECPDCSGDGLAGGPAPLDLEKQVLFTKIREIEADVSLSEREKARRRQELLSGNVNGENGDVKEEKENDVLGVLGDSFKCCYCMELPERPVTTPCGHNFCLKCFEKWMKQGKRNCAKCRCSIPAKMASQPRINSALVSAIRMAKLSRSISSGGTQQVYRFLHNQDHSYSLRCKLSADATNSCTSSPSLLSFLLSFFFSCFSLNSSISYSTAYDHCCQSLQKSILTLCFNRSEKDKRSSYAPEKGYRYDGVYRIEKCWRKAGKQGFKVCRYLFVRCDNEPAPWTSDEHGDRPRELPVISELKGAVDVTQRKESPSWDYDEVACCWKWKRPPPHSEEKVVSINPKDRENGMKVIRRAQAVSMRERLLKGFCCLVCKNVMNQPLTTPCAHNFCKPCLEKQFAGQTFSKERVCHNGRKLRSQRNILNCPACPTDISEFLQNPQVNREIKDVIERLQSEIAKEEELKGSNTTSEEANAGEEKNDTLPGEIMEVIEKLQSETAKEEEYKDSNTTSEETNAGEEKNDDTLPGADVGKKSNEQTEGQHGESNTLKRKGSSSSLSNDNEEIHKKAKVDNGDESVLSSEEKPDGDCNNVLQASVTKRGRGRPRKGEPKC
ncbi:E3 ubiquitin-protein ligase ORTHRUS 2 [Striga hermonthica]|uniref:RING-type E3 ubiquitin transferase n=1 Tax=Striga hermonthica TaxID=68872 RepID=A0A9N7R7V2_STRHE|nr:E3 ubiquitin-protein ligase ORTHRUS 2 [Striga hermonthica]